MLTTTSFLQYGLGFMGLLVAVYILVRVGAVAWFRTRREHAHRIMKDMKGED